MVGTLGREFVRGQTATDVRVWVAVGDPVDRVGQQGRCPPTGSRAGRAGYQQILPLRTRNSVSIAALLHGVPDGYRAASYLDTLQDQTLGGSSG